MSCFLAPAACKPRTYPSPKLRTCVLFTAVLLGPGCERAALEKICPELAPGELVVSELRGKQSGADSYGQWVELYNASEKTINLGGLTLRLRKLDGSGEKDLLIRSERVAVEPGGYATLGRFDSRDLPAHIDVGWGTDSSSELYSDGIVEIRSCQQFVDAVSYRALPGAGTLAYDGRLLPDAEENDDPQRWCVDQTEDSGGDGGAQNLGIPGTPRAENRPCND